MTPSSGDPAATLSAQHRALLDRRLAALGVAARADTGIPRLPRTGPDQTFPCSAGQQRMWLAMRYDPQDPEYNVSNSLRLTGELDHAALKAAFDDLVVRRESLRTVYHDEDGVAYQRVLAPTPVPMELVDLRHLPAAAREDAAVRLARDAAKRVFDLETGPLLTVSLYRLADDEHALVFICHHIAIDGWSLGIATGEVARRYEWRRSGATGPAPLAPLPIQYPDYAAWQRRLLDTGAFDPQLDFWRETLAAPRATLELPIAHRRPTADGRPGGGAKQGFTVAQAVLDGLRRGADGGTTTFVLLLAGFKALLARYCDQADVTMGTLVAARTQVELEPMVGYLANPLPLRTRLEADLSYRAAVARVRRTVIDAFGHQDVPFDEVVRATSPQRDRGRHPLFQTAFLLYNFAQEPARWSGLDVGWWEYGLDDPLFDMTLIAVPGADGIDATLLYRRETFPAADMSG